MLNDLFLKKKIILKFNRGGDLNEISKFNFIV